MADGSAGPVDGFDLEQFLPYRMQRLSAQLASDFFSRLARRQASHAECGWAEWIILTALAEQGGITARDIAQHSGLGKTAISRAVATLERSGWLARTRDSEDRRVERLHPSSAGLQEHQAMKHAAAEYANLLARHSGGEEISGMVAFLNGVEEFLALGVPEIA